MLAACASAAALSIAVPAQAHPLVDEGREKYAEADLQGALDAFARAEASDDLTLPDLLSLLETRVLVHRALGNEEAATRDLRWLAAIAPPTHELPSEAPPEMARELDDLWTQRGGAIAINVGGHAEGDAVVLTARVERAPEGMVRETRIHHREPGMPWNTTVGSEARIAATTVEHWAEAVGPGGAVLATAASADAPRRFAAGDGPLGGEETGGGVPPWAWIAGGAVAVGLIVVAAVLIGSSGGGESDQTQPAFPQVEF